MLINSFTANGGAFIFGNLIGWSAPAANLIIKQDEDDYYFWVSSDQFAWIVAFMALGAALSCVLSGVLRSKLGTKFTIALFAVPVTIGWALTSFPLNPAMVNTTILFHVTKILFKNT